MRNVLVPIVEGDGEVEAIPVLLRRLLAVRQRWELKVARPKNAHGCGNLTKSNGLEKFVELAFRERGCAGVLVVMDADGEDACPVRMAASFVERILLSGPRHPVAVVFARREYEAWFLASLESVAGHLISGKPALPADLTFTGEVEDVRDVKGWMSRRFLSNRKYKETQDQAPMTERLDIVRAAERSRSFRRLCKALDELIDAWDNDRVVVTPQIGSAAV